MNNFDLYGWFSIVWIILFFMIRQPVILHFRNFLKVIFSPQPLWWRKNVLYVDSFFYF